MCTGRYSPAVALSTNRADRLAIVMEDARPSKGDVVRLGHLAPLLEGLPGLVEEVAADRVTIAVLDPVTRKRIARVAVPALAIRTVWSQAERRRLG
jgi:hypothetical protein